MQVALKFEHRSSKGCNYGPPYEWSVYKWVADIMLCNWPAYWPHIVQNITSASPRMQLAGWGAWHPQGPLQRETRRLLHHGKRNGNKTQPVLYLRHQDSTIFLNDRSWTCWGRAYGMCGTSQGRSCPKRWWHASESKPSPSSKICTQKGEKVHECLAHAA